MNKYPNFGKLVHRATSYTTGKSTDGFYRAAMISTLLHNEIYEPGFLDNQQHEFILIVCLLAGFLGLTLFFHFVLLALQGRSHQRSSRRQRDFLTRLQRSGHNDPELDAILASATSPRLYPALSLATLFGRSAPPPYTPRESTQESVISSTTAAAGNNVNPAPDHAAIVDEPIGDAGTAIEFDTIQEWTPPVYADGTDANANPAEPPLYDSGSKFFFKLTTNISEL